MSDETYAYFRAFITELIAGIIVFSILRNFF